VVHGVGRLRLIDDRLVLGIDLVARVAWKLMVSGQCYSMKSAPTALARAA
jgi:hypothetical protein